MSRHVTYIYVPFFTVPGVNLTLYLKSLSALYGPHTGTAYNNISSGRGLANSKKIQKDNFTEDGCEVQMVAKALGIFFNLKICVYVHICI